MDDEVDNKDEMEGLRGKRTLAKVLFGSNAMVAKASIETCLSS